MHNNYYFLRQLSKQLDEILIGAKLVECFSQNKDELIVVFEKHQQYFTIKAHLLSTFSCLSFPREFHRARKNSIDLFSEIINCTVDAIQQFENERSFAFHFGNKKSLLFKMHGNKSNVILFNGDEKILFKNSLPGDETIVLGEMNRGIDFSKSAFENNSDSLKKLYLTFGPLVWEYLKEKGFDECTAEQQWEMLSETIQKLNTPNFYITNLNNSLSFSLLPVGETVKESTNPMEVLNEFFYAYTQTNVLETEKQKAISSLTTKLKASQSFLTKTNAKRKELKEENTYKVWADLLMANLYSIPERAKKISLPDFQEPSKLIEIPLSETLNPQKNAERYYRKSKNHQIEINRLEEIILAKEKEISTLESQLVEVTNDQDLKRLRQHVEHFGLQKKKQTEEIILPYKATEFQGFQIWIGKNAKSNDELTLKYSYKEDLWLHAKDVSGSHVIIKYKSGNPFPKEVIERGAQLAAYFSKRKNESLCPVAYTQKKFVRKRKGDPAGAVVVEKETVIMVEPAGI